MSIKIEDLVSDKVLSLQEHEGINFFAKFKLDENDQYLIYIDVYEGTVYDDDFNMEEYELFMKAEYFVLRDKLIIREQEFSINSYNASQMLFNLYHIMRNINEY